MDNQSISAEFPFESNFVTVYGSQMHYIDEGEGDPILFLHGNPTSSYLWRNIIPHVTGLGRAIAPDLIGMGQSDKPDLTYRFHDHYKYIEGFIEALDLKNITLVIHDWGSGLGFHYAAQHPERITRIAFMEGMVKPLQWSDFPGAFGVIFRLMRSPGIGWLMNGAGNFFVKQIIPQSVVRKLSPAEKEVYGRPFQTITSRTPVRQWPREIPISGTPNDMQEIISNYSRWLQKSDIPKLLFYAQPGGLIQEKMVKWCEDNFPNLKTIDIGPGLHYVQEDNPHMIGSELARWVALHRASQSTAPAAERDC